LPIRRAPLEYVTADARSGGFFGFHDMPDALPFGELGDPTVGGRFYELGEPI
jgi:hypothetical protein